MFLVLLVLRFEVCSVLVIKPVFLLIHVKKIAAERDIHTHRETQNIASIIMFKGRQAHTRWI